MICTTNYMTFENMCNKLIYEKDRLSEEFIRYVAISNLIKENLDRCRNDGDEQEFKLWREKLKELNCKLDSISAELNHVITQYKQLT